MAEDEKKNRARKMPPAPGRGLRQALTHEEFDQVLSGALLSLDEDGRTRLLASLPASVAGAVRDALSDTPISLPPRPTADRVRAEWEQGLSRIDSLAFETSDELGNYVQQDPRWEPPWVDIDAFAVDIEPVARELRALLPRVLDEDLDPDFDPLDFLAVLEDEIGAGLPEWIDPLTDDLHLGPEVTGLLVDHADLCAARDRAGPFEVAEYLLSLDSSTEHLRLDRESLSAWFAARSEADARTISEGIAACSETSLWGKELPEPQSVWSRIARDLAGQSDPTLAVALARVAMAGQPEIAVPVFRDLLEQGEDEEILHLLPVAVCSARFRSSFDPEDELLAAHRDRGEGPKGEAVITILSLARDAARRLDRRELAAALLAQIALLRAPYDWKEARRVLRALGEAHPPTARRFEEQWRELQTQGTAAQWMPDLLDAFFLPEGCAAAFAEAIGERLATEGCATCEPEGSTAYFSRIARPASPVVLALDITTPGDRRSHPVLFRYLERVVDDRHSSPVQSGRRAALKALDAAALLPRIIEWFRERPRGWMPDPADGAGRYEEHAEALCALRELDPLAADAVLDEWRVDHCRRRNLWSALAREGFQR